MLLVPARRRNDTMQTKVPRFDEENPEFNTYVCDGHKPDSHVEVEGPRVSELLPEKKQ